MCHFKAFILVTWNQENVASENDTKEIFRGAFWSPNCEVSIVPCRTVIMGWAELSVEINLEKYRYVCWFLQYLVLIPNWVSLRADQTKLWSQPEISFICSQAIIGCTWKYLGRFSVLRFCKLRVYGLRFSSSWGMFPRNKRIQFFRATVLVVVFKPYK